VAQRSAARFNSALIDLGALICLPRKPRCRICPVRKFCRATNPEILPVRKTRPRTKLLTESHAFVVSRNKILLERSDGRWRVCGYCRRSKQDRRLTVRFTGQSFLSRIIRWRSMFIGAARKTDKLQLD
jgi:adenine-specific DNA glycosylase